ncbi:MAG: hypothetical protein A3H97_06450 [Acidobacteria bacterium RIFCSPLOWO2_02_FULL_65_29]|nr:MAG: hypothetical protein A3H97_06450 [Acidobacteria bacterium RIFCSPLOWO2_02_FULL_65_29]
MGSSRLAPTIAFAVTLALKPDAPLDVAVDVTALAEVSPHVLHATMGEASALWRPAGVTLVWVTSPTARSLPDVRLTLDVVPEAAGGGASAGGTSRLGMVVFLGDSANPERRLGLSVEAVGRLIDDAPWAGRRVADWPPRVREQLLGRALGRVLSHEIGHYLLAWRGHTTDGLMRAAFSGSRLIDPDRRPYTLSHVLLPRLGGRLAQLSGRGAIAAAVD